MSVAVHATPAPSPEEAAAITAAVRVLLEQARHGAGTDARPPAYRSAWRHAAIREGAGLFPTPMRSR